MATPGVSHNGRTISRENLQQMIERKIKFTLVDVLDPQSYGAFHLPGAINIALDDQFETAMAAAVPDKDDKIVVYGADHASHVSSQAARKLLDLGYTRVRDFEDGKAGWRDVPAAADIPLEPAAPSPKATRRAIATVRPPAADAPAASPSKS